MEAIYSDLKSLVININLLTLILCKNGLSTMNTTYSSNILRLFYIFLKPFLRTIILGTNILIGN